MRSNRHMDRLTDDDLFDDRDMTPNEITLNQWFLMTRLNTLKRYFNVKFEKGITPLKQQVRNIT